MTSQQGRPVQSIPQGTRSTQIPERFAEHPLVAGQYFYTLPTALIDLFKSNVGMDKLDSDLLCLEYSLAEICGDHSLHVGVYNGMVFCSPMLNRNPIAISPKEAAWLGLNLSEQELRDRSDLADDRSFAIWKQSRAYLGWLFTNPDFLAERDALIDANRKQILATGFPQSTRTDLARHPEVKRERNAAAKRLAHDVRLFCERWRLLKIDGPLLATPLQPQTPALYPAHYAASLSRGETTSVMPDICSDPSRGPVADMVHESLGHDNPGADHLADWKGIVDRSNKSRGTIVKYERLFIFHHYVRVLYGRHGSSLHRAGVRVRNAIATFMIKHHAASSEKHELWELEELLRKDQQELNRILGKKWEMHPQI